MIIDKSAIQPYPYTGSFYRYVIDESKPLDEQVMEEVLLLETECDVQQETSTDNGTITSLCTIFFPYVKSVGINIKGGDTFRCNLNGLQINGIINVPYPNQLNVCEVTLKDFDI